jgi:chromosome segregation ATPase
MKKYLSFMLVMVLAVFTFGQVALAEDGSTADDDATIKSSVTNPLPSDLKQKIEEQREALKKALEAKKDALKKDIEERTDSFKADIAAQREAFKAALEARKKEIQAVIQSDRESFKKKLESEKAEFKTNIKEKRGEFRGKAKEVLSNRFEAAVNNIARLQDKVQARIDVLKSAGQDVSQAEVYLADSKTKLADAKTKLAEIEKLIPSTDEKVTVENWEKIKDGANVVKGLIKEAHASLVEAVKVLKGLGKVEKPEEDKNDDSSESTQ